MKKSRITFDSEAVRQRVREGYGQIASRGGSCCGGCGQTVEKQKTSQHSRNKQMKTAAAIGMIAAAFGLCAFAAENNQSLPASGGAQAAPAGGKGAAVMQQAASANKYLFAFFYEKDDAATRATRKTFDNAVKKITPAAESVAVDRNDPAWGEVVAKFAVDRAPMPLVLAIAPNGAVTGGFKAADLTEQRLGDMVASPAMQQCLKALQERKLVFVCLQNGHTKANEAAMKGVNEFRADPQFAEAAEIVKVDPADAREAKLVGQLKVDPKAKTANTALLAPPGMLVTSVEGATSKAGLEAALKKASSSCAPGSGCCPAPKK